MSSSRNDKTRRSSSVTRSRAGNAEPSPAPGTPKSPVARKGKAVRADGAAAGIKPAPPSQQQVQVAAARDLALRAARSLRDDKCTDVLVLDVQGHSNVWDFVVIATGTSDRQMRAAADHVRTLARDLGHGVLRDNADDRCSWVLLDCVDVCVHVFEEATRGYYDLESMFDESPRLEWDLPDQRPAQRTPSRRG